MTLAPEHDPFLWLEEIEGPAALDWVRARNARTLAELGADPRHAALERDALAIIRAQDRLTFDGVVAGYVSNFWQDDVAVRGLWRRSPFEAWRAGAPAWETILDVDALAAAEGKNWVYKGAASLDSERWETRALLHLSDGGKDAVAVREFDLAAKRFVEGGFALPEAKQDVTWLDADTLLVATDWGGDTLTESGYPFVVKTLRRGQPLEAAQEIFRGAKTDVAVGAFRLDDGRRHHHFLHRATSFFTSETFWLKDNGAIARLRLPSRATVTGLLHRRLLFSTQEPWTPPGAAQALPVGGLYAADLEALAGEAAVSVETLYTPAPREALAAAAVSADALYLAIQRNVVSEIRRLPLRADGPPGPAEIVPLPDRGVAGLADVSRRETRVFISFNNLLTPPSIAMGDAGAAPVVVQAQPARFDASGLTLDQFEARSRDGTMVPYFIARPAAASGPTPTLLYGYGGFEVSLTPDYAAMTGKLWLERGGAYVIANIRGGGEFGPEWHQAGLKTSRQVVYDDFIAVAEDLIARGLTAPRRLGMMGGSNGGLLMGVILNQRPDLFHAAVIQVPLLDMLRFHRLLAGASWIDEYGDPEDDDERAWLERLSPYHNLVARPDFPEPLIVTSTKDDRVHPGHARKYAARLEALGLPYLYYENIDGGHSAAANLVEAAKRRALEFTYLTRRLMD